LFPYKQQYYHLKIFQSQYLSEMMMMEPFQFGGVTVSDLEQVTLQSVIA
jgi:hypothetical protein